MISIIISAVPESRTVKYKKPIRGYVLRDY